MTERTVRLHHFTSAEAFFGRPGIKVSGLIEPSIGRGEGTPFVWLLDTPRCPAGRYGIGQSSGLRAIYDRTLIRVTVKVPDAVRWLDYLDEFGRTPADEERIEEDGGIEASRHTWVVPGRAIDAKEWVEVVVVNRTLSELERAVRDSGRLPWQR